MRQHNRHLLNLRAIFSSWQKICSIKVGEKNLIYFGRNWNWSNRSICFISARNSKKFSETNFFSSSNCSDRFRVRLIFGWSPIEGKTRFSTFSKYRLKFNCYFLSPSPLPLSLHGNSLSRSLLLSRFVSSSPLSLCDFSSLCPWSFLSDKLNRVHRIWNWPGAATALFKTTAQRNFCPYQIISSVLEPFLVKLRLLSRPSCCLGLVFLLAICQFDVQSVFRNLQASRVIRQTHVMQNRWISVETGDELLLFFALC